MTTERIRLAREELATAKEEREAERRAAHKIQMDEDARLVNECRVALEKECGTGNCIVADALWAIAWEEAHSSGFEQIKSAYRDYAERLVVPMIAALAGANAA